MPLSNTRLLKIEREYDTVGILLKDRIFSETYKSLDLYIFDKKRAKFRFTYAY